MTSAPQYGWPLAGALVLLLALALGIARVGRLPVKREIVGATARAIVQLIAVSAVVGVVMTRTWAALLFALAMFTIAVVTAGGRTEARRRWLWIALGLAAGVAPVLTIIFATRSAAFTGPAIVPIAGIVIGGSMTANTLTTRRAFDALRSDLGQVEAGLALGLTRPHAILNVIGRHAPEALTPILDQTRTVGLVTLPGAFVGVLLGGGSAADAAASQVLVLIGLLAAETTVVVASQQLIAHGRLLSPDLERSLPRC